MIKNGLNDFITVHKSDKHEFGTRFHISRHIVDNLLDVEPVNERIGKLGLNLISPVCVFYVSVLSPLSI